VSRPGALRLYLRPADAAALPAVPRLDALLSGSDRGAASQAQVSASRPRRAARNGSASIWGLTMGAAKTPQLLVSVRSVAEVEPALAGGAALIDVKEPTRGS